MGHSRKESVMSDHPVGSGLLREPVMLAQTIEAVLSELTEPFCQASILIRQDY